MKHLLLTLSLLAASFTAAAENLGNQFVPAKLKYDVTVAVPRSWQVLRGDELRSIETAVGAAIDLSGYSKALEGADTLLVAVFPHPKLYAGVTITATPVPGVTPDLIARLSESDVRSGQSAIREGIEMTQSRLGARVWGWSALKKDMLGERAVMHISYFRSSEGGDRKVQLYKFFGVGRSYDMALSTSVEAEAINRVVLEKIARSFSVR